jgi:hypothetical protein
MAVPAQELNVVANAARAGVGHVVKTSSTPTFFINGRRHYGSYDIAALTSAVLAAKAAATAPADDTR